MNTVLRQAINKVSECCIEDKKPIVRWPKYICPECGVIFEDHKAYKAHLLDLPF